MNICQNQLNALQASSGEIEELMRLARQHGASGTKSTGGGAMIALCHDGGARVVQAMHDAGYQALGGPLADAAQLHPTVSSEAEPLILVDADDRPLGHASKAACHDGRGQRHRAFSLFIFNEHGKLLLQQRSRGKRLWPGYWANSCCSHPRQDESMEQATERRLQQELGMRCPLRFLFKFEYHADYRGLGAEHELCWVYTGTCAQPVRANATEVDAWRFVTPAELDREIVAYPEHFTPWLKLEWERLRHDPAVPAW